MGSDRAAGVAVDENRSPPQPLKAVAPAGLASIKSLVEGLGMQGAAGLGNLRAEGVKGQGAEGLKVGLEALTSAAQAVQSLSTRHLAPHAEGARAETPPQRNPFPPLVVEGLKAEGPRAEGVKVEPNPRGGLSVAQLMLSPSGSQPMSPATSSRRLSVDFLSGGAPAPDWGSEIKKKSDAETSDSKRKEPASQPLGPSASGSAATGPPAKKAKTAAKSKEEEKAGGKKSSASPPLSKAASKTSKPPTAAQVAAHGAASAGASQPSARRPARAQAAVSQPLNLRMAQPRKPSDSAVGAQQLLQQQHNNQQILLAAQQLGLMSSVPTPPSPNHSAPQSHQAAILQLQQSMLNTKPPHPLEQMYQQQLQHRIPMLQQQQQRTMQNILMRPPNGAGFPPSPLGPTPMRPHTAELNPFGDLGVGYQAFGRVAEKDIPSSFSMNEGTGLKIKVETPDMKKGPNRHSKYCHFCQHIKNTMVACTSGPCTFKFCHHCLSVHLHEDWESILAAVRRGTWKCPCCRNKCCCCSTRRCTQNHPHCKAYRKRLQTKIGGNVELPEGVKS